MVVRDNVSLIHSVQIWSAKSFRWELPHVLLSGGPLSYWAHQTHEDLNKTQCAWGWLLVLNATGSFDFCLLGAMKEQREPNGFWRSWKKCFVSCLSHSLESEILSSLAYVCLGGGAVSMWVCARWCVCRYYRQLFFVVEFLLTFSTWFKTWEDILVSI